MNRTIFIHAGMHKTGSTAIQKFLTANRDRLHDLGLYLPIAGSEVHGHNHMALVGAVAHFDQPDTRDAFDRLNAELADAGYPQRVVISAEDFSPKFSRQPYLDKLADFCAALGYAPHLIVYVRPQAAAINSMFTQNVKNWRQVKPFHKYFQERLAAPVSQLPFLFAALRADRRFQLTVRPYSRTIVTAGLNADFLDVVDLPRQDAGFMYSSELVNAAPGPKTVAAFLRLGARMIELQPAPNPAILKALTRPLIAAAGQRGWNDTKFDAIDEDRLRRAKARFGEQNESFARAVWQKSWFEVFPEEENRVAAPNVFIYKDASPAEQDEFRAFVRQAMDTIRRFDANPSLSQPGEADDDD